MMDEHLESSVTKYGRVRKVVRRTIPRIGATWAGIIFSIYSLIAL